MNNIAIIPARAGSKGVKHKNLQKIGRMNLIDRAINAAKLSTIFDRIILSTDITTSQLDYEDDSKVIIHSRLPKLCDDVANMDQVIRNIIKYFNIQNSLIWLLQPSSPFRHTKDFHAIEQIFTGDKVNSIISVCDVGANHPNRMYTIVKDKLKPIRFSSFKNKQELPEMYIRSGHYYVFKSKLFQTSFSIDPCYAFKIEKQRCINIDDYFDLELAKLVYKGGLLKDEYS